MGYLYPQPCRATLTIPHFFSSSSYNTVPFLFFQPIYFKSCCSHNSLPRKPTLIVTNPHSNPRVHSKFNLPRRPPNSLRRRYTHIKHSSSETWHLACRRLIHTYYASVLSYPSYGATPLHCCSTYRMKTHQRSTRTRPLHNSKHTQMTRTGTELQWFSISTHRSCFLCATRAEPIHIPCTIP
jgi:hypothetical protein